MIRILRKSILDGTGTSPETSRKELCGGWCGKTVDSNEPRAGRHDRGEVGFPAVKLAVNGNPDCGQKTVSEKSLKFDSKSRTTSLIQQGTTRLHPTRARREIVGSSVSRVFTLENYKVYIVEQT